MADLDTTDLKAIFKMFGDEVKALVTQIFTQTNMEDEHFATVVSGGIVGAIDGSVRALQVYKANELISEQIKTELKKTQLTQEQIYTVIAKRTREQGAIVENGTLTFTINKSSQVENQIDLLKKQIEKVAEDKKFVTKQGTNMDKQVIHNCIIQAMDKAEGYNMGIGNAGLIPSQDMHTNFFVQNKALLVEAGCTFATDGTVTFKNVVLGKFNTSADATEATT